MLNPIYVILNQERQNSEENHDYMSHFQICPELKIMFITFSFKCCPKNYRTNYCAATDSDLHIL